jgi:hypothetical protein
MEMATRRMAQQPGSTRKADGNVAGYEAAPGTGLEDAAPGPVARRWRDFLTGPRLPSGPALAVIALASLVLWAGIIWLLYYILHR